MKERGNAWLKFLDRWLGIPMMAMVGALRTTRRLPKDIRTIGVFKEVSIGDTVLLAGPMRDLRNAFPDARIVVFAGSSNNMTAHLLPCVDEIVSVQVTRPWCAIHEIRERAVDVWLDFGQWPRINAFYTWIARARYTVGYRTRGQFRHFAYDASVEHRCDQHELENYRDVIRALGVPVGAAADIQAIASNSPVQGDYVVFHPWPSGMLSHLREWNEERWIELSRLVRSKNFKIVLTGAPGDAERCKALVQKMGETDVIDRSGMDGLNVVKDLLAAASAVVSVNTGIMHLAAAVGAPTISLNGPTSELRWGPVGARAFSVSVPPPYGGYLNLGFEYEGQYHESMTRIEVSDVWNLLLPLLTEKT